ncbi:ABC transporter substrate-binding protein [Falsarthrobacter nasiphocae]|uniref:Osmoprotectant transport system substrate-binding protein n=1 Tax=Falsarthrobacter nasiphocae TaxID=189863 RepID=A0AAE3YDV4_9MICC|nr:ABC transporter substrate-binding protein [Falsarthrobacter nasiphocae]MDR6891569.1 osmoprotectant transport system substrate-binding protein [Falsarthrobacter nasiphocae]
MNESRPIPSPRRRPSRRGVIASTALVAALALAGCSSDNPLDAQTDTSTKADGSTITVGAADFPESEVIANLYAGALKESGFQVNVKAGIGSREVYVKAIQDGSVDVVPDYNGNLLSYFKPKSTEKTSAEVTKALQSATPEGLTVLPAAQAEDTDSLVVTAVTAEKYKLASIEDLAKVCDQLTLGAPAEFAKREGGLPGLKSVYGCEFKSFKPIADGGGPLTVKALTSDDVQVADIFSTSPAIEDNGLVTLEDTKNNWASQQVVPLGRTAKLDDKAKAAIAKVQSKLTTADLVALNRKVSGTNKVEPSAAANQWLKEKGIVK